MKIGILGVGVIGSAIIEGFCYDNDMSHSLYLSPRGKELSQQLESKYDNVIRCASNQEVIDHSDVVIISILPEIGLDILKLLTFNKNQHVINLMRNIKLDEIEAVIGEIKSLTHMVPLSFIENRIGPIAIYPKNDVVIQLFRDLGKVIPYNEMAKIESVASITGLMTSYYNLLNEVSNWGVKNGLTKDEAVEYITSFFESLTLHGKSDLERLSAEVTPGGINEYALKRLQNQNVFSEITRSLDFMLKEVKNR